MQGRFEPVNIDTEILNDVSAFYRSIGRPFDRRGLQRELQKIRREYQTRRLTAEGVEERQRRAFPVETSQAPTTTEVAPAPAAPVEMGAAPILPSVAAPAPTPPGPPITDLGALVKDPRTRELVERQRGLG